MQTSSDDRLRPLPLLILIVVLAPVLFLGWAYWRDSSLTKGFDKISVGTTKEDVARLMGKPKKILKCGEFFGPLPKSEMEGCVSEHLYAATFAPYTPEYYVVRFDVSGHVCSKTPYSSP
jgi:hypothetical protein